MNGACTAEMASWRVTRDMARQRICADLNLRTAVLRYRRATYVRRAARACLLPFASWYAQHLLRTASLRASIILDVTDIASLRRLYGIVIATILARVATIFARLLVASATLSVYAQTRVYCATFLRRSLRSARVASRAGRRHA